jgi:chromosome segregation ATPase
VWHLDAHTRAHRSEEFRRVLFRADSRITELEDALHASKSQLSHAESECDRLRGRVTELASEKERLLEERAALQVARAVRGRARRAVIHCDSTAG